MVDGMVYNKSSGAERSERMPIRGPSGEELLTTSEAAKSLGLSESAIRTQIQKGRLERVLPDPSSPRVAFVTRASVEAYRQASLGKFGNPNWRKKPEQG
jgi:hypothetical protein